jgi:hypothetical protein
MAPIPDPRPGLIFRYGYVWVRDFKKNPEFVGEDRPACIVMKGVGRPRRLASSHRWLGDRTGRRDHSPDHDIASTAGRYRDRTFAGRETYLPSGPRQAVMARRFGIQRRYLAECRHEPRARNKPFRFRNGAAGTPGTHRSRVRRSAQAQQGSRNQASVTVEEAKDRPESLVLRHAEYIDMLQEASSEERPFGLES